MITIEGITQQVTISRNANAIPTIKAATDLDAFFSLGFTHAQDRLWQMETNRAIAAGKLSTIIGEEGLQSDILMRTMGLKHNAETMAAAITGWERQVLDAYVKGVNQGISQLNTLPTEYHLLGITPAAWTDVDSMLWMQLMSFRLSASMWREIAAATLVQSFGVDKVQDLLPNYPLDLATDTLAFNSQSLDSLLKMTPDNISAPKPHMGSNSWVVSGRHTASKKPLLANDPHLNNSLPSIFYLASLQGDKINIKGATFPGLPFIVIGANEHISWGMTNMLADNEDVYLEKINPNNRYQYEVDGQYRDMEVSVEEIAIKQDLLRRQPEPYQLEVRRTHHGPILSDVFIPQNNYAYSVRSTADDQTGGTFKSFLALNYAKDWESFNTALSDFVAPIHNFVYADKSDNIGYLAPGAFPLRKSNNGPFPVAGWLSENDWQGWIPTAQWPREYNPERGYIITANNNVPGDDYPYYLGSDWAPGYRAKHIQQQLDTLINEQGGKLTASDMQSIQLDVTSPALVLLRPYIEQISATSPSKAQLIAPLLSWDGNMAIDSSEATLFYSWMQHYKRLLLEDNAERINNTQQAEQLLRELILEDNLPFIVRTLKNNSSGWCNYLRREGTQDCLELLSISLDHTINELERELGSNINNWQWGNAHKAHYPHFPFSDPNFGPDLPDDVEYPWDFVFHRSISAVGGGYTVNVAPASFAEESRFAQFYGATFRQVIDMSEPHQAAFSLSTGQSGNVLSPHYDDMLPRHQQGRYTTIGQEQAHNLTLLPQHTTKSELQ
ncbi:penicillin acylase family protein [Photobacterium makurazakiensis]|uniref:penicillin acylase family protein n=1 Tax=Photobacterium makurazakiensis TaxID=2910234 RepID=UPI003D14EB91